MNLISILLALAVETFYKPVAELRRFDWFNRYHAKLYGLLGGQPLRDGPVGVILLVGLVALVVWIVLAILASVSGLLAFLFGLVVLIFTLGPRDLEQDVEEILTCLEHNDTEAAMLKAQHLDDCNDVEANSPQELVRWVRDRVLVEANTRLFGVLFWFLLLGPIGAVLFRLTCLARQQPSVENDYLLAARDLYRILAWIPARLSVLCYALAGNFVDTFSHWNHMSDLWKRDSESFLVASGNGAIAAEFRRDEEEGGDSTPIKQAMALVKRALIVWIALLALLTLTGLIF